jgi:hypothetical protein
VRGGSGCVVRRAARGGCGMKAASEAIVFAGLVLDSLLPSLESAMEHASATQEDGPEFTAWMNGAIYGAVSTYLHDNSKNPPAVAQITSLCSHVSALITESMENDDFNLDVTMRRLVPEACGPSRS